MAMNNQSDEVKQLTTILHSITPEFKQLPGSGDHSNNRMGVCMDECFPGLYIGNYKAATTKDYLKVVGITHVLNTAQGSNFATVNTNDDFYKDTNIKYLGLKLLDVPSANIAQYFEAGTNFIHEALSTGGRILVHCFMGISRSATISAAYLMMKHNMSAADALTTLRKNRAIYPNDGFLRQLTELERSLKEPKSVL